MDPVMALSALQKGVVVLAFTGIVAPLVGLVLKRAVGGWSSYGGGPFSILNEAPARRGGPEAPVDPAIQAAEVRQMLAAKAERQRRRGEPALDVEAEAERLLAVAAEHGAPSADEELRAEVRQLVVLRNERRRRKGLEPLDVEAETDRQLADFIGSR